MERMASLLDNTGILFKLHTEVRANNLSYHSNCLKTFQYHYEMFLKKKKKKKTKKIRAKMTWLSKKQLHLKVV